MLFTLSLSSLLQPLTSSSLWFMLNKPCLAIPAQTSTKCRMRKTQTCRNDGDELALVDQIVFPFFFFFTLSVWKKGKPDSTVEDASLTSTSFFPRVKSNPPHLRHKQHSFLLMELWQWSHICLHTCASIFFFFFLTNKTDSNKSVLLQFPKPTGNSANTHPV